MKIHARRCRQSASILLISLVISGVLALGAASYMVYIGTQADAMTRSRNWNSAMPIVEAGIDEALAHMNYGIVGTFESNVMARWSSDQWRDNGGVLSSPTRTIDGNFYNVRITTNVPGGARNPEIICVGNVLTTSYATSGRSRVASSNYVARQVRVRTERIDLNQYALLGEGAINLNGQCFVDSFNSMTTNSFYGLYDGRYRSDEGSIGSITNDINMGSQGTLYGTNYTSASGSATNGTVGDEAWIDGGNTGTQPGHYQDDLNTELYPIGEPQGRDYGTPPGPLTLTLTNFASGTNLTRIVSDTYPVPPPPDGRVQTNYDRLVTTLTWPTNIDPNLIQTNTTYLLSTNWPTNVAASLIVTNPAVTWYTNPAPPSVASTNTAVSYPTGYSVPPGVQIISNRVVNWYLEPGPPAGTYVSGSVSGGPPFSAPSDYDKEKRNGVWGYYYTYQWIKGYRFKYPESYSWPTNAYTYPTVAYIYNGPLTNTTIITRTYRYVLDSTTSPVGYYKMTYLSMAGSDLMLVRGNAVLWVTGPISMAGQSQIIILPGASLTIYAGGDVALQGQGIINENNNAMNLTLYGLEGCKNIQLGGNAAFTGTIYAPDADFRANGGGNSNYDIVGAITAGSIQMNGHFEMHYDANLRNASRVGGYIVRGWFEERVGTR